MITANATEFQNNFGRYAAQVEQGETIIVVKNGKEIGRFVPKDVSITFLADSLKGVLKGNYDYEKEKKE